MSQSTPVPAVGTRMANIHLTSANGSTSTLDEVRGSSDAVVFFLRASSCAICLGHARAIETMAKDGELNGAKVVLVTPGDASQAAQAASRLAGTGADVWASGDEHAEVGLGKFLAIQHSGTFLVGADGAVRYSKTSTLPMGSFSRPELESALASS